MKKGKAKDPALAKRARAKTLARAKSYWQLYLFLIPAILYFGIFRYTPMAGLQMAFKNYNVIQGIWGSPWAKQGGFEHFIRFFNSPDCWMVIRNTLKISILSLIFGFPLPIIVALLINQTRSKRYGKVVQTTLYAPHFISAVIIVGMLNLFLSPSTGIINQIIVKLGGQSVMFMGIAPMFPIIYVITEIWQNTGYNSIVYTAALSGVSPELHESAIMDGASILQRIRYIDLPCIMPTIIILLIMNTGRVLTVGYEKIYLMQNSLNRSASEVISTYVYKQAFGSSSLPNFSYSAAIGFFESVVSLILLVVVNKIAQKYADMSLV